MNDRPKKPLRWRPRLSLRALLGFTLIAGIYFCCGRITKSKGARDVTLHLEETGGRPKFHTQFVAPFLYRNDSIVDSTSESLLETTRQVYYLWFFGFIAKLPFETHQNRAVTLAVEDEFEETYFPVRSSTSRHKTAVPVREWRMQYDDSILIPAAK